MARPRLGHGLDLWMNGELVGQRFDRRLASDGRWWLRLLQEDGCQALGLPPGLKYQSDGGPGITDLMALLGGSQQPQEDRLQLFRWCWVPAGPFALLPCMTSSLPIP